MKKIIVLILISYLLFISNVKSKEIVIPDEAIRLRIIANSNNEYDQNIKMKLSIEIEKKISELLKDTKDVNEAKKIIKNNIGTLNKYVQDFLEKENYNMKYTIVYGDNYFPNKTYNGVTYNEGLYESLLITLGKGEGKNWWCVLFPPLCLMEEESDNTEYKFFVKELINKYF